MKLLFLSFGLLISLSSYAELTCSKKGTKLIYVNGVRTEKWEADDALRALKNLVPLSELDKESKVIPVLSYNFTYGFARDFLETIVQRFPREFLVSSSFKDGYAAYMQLMQGTLVGTLFPIVLDDIINSAEELEALATNLARDTTALVTHYKNALEGGYKVLAVSHSQGGLFMNDAYNRIDVDGIRKEDLFAGLQIATPINAINIPRFGYVTNDNDRVINLVRSQFGALEPNIDVFFASNTFNGVGDVPDFFLNHGLLTTYLYDSDIRAKVLSELKVVAERLESNCETRAGCGGVPGRIAQGGAFVASTAILEDTVSITFGGGVDICENAKVYGNASINGFMTISGSAQVYGNARVNGFGAGILITDFAEIKGTVNNFGPLTFMGSSKIHEGSAVSGEGTLDGAEVGSSEVTLDQSYVQNSKISNSKVYVESNVSDSTITDSEIKTSFIASSTIENSKIISSGVNSSMLKNSIVNASSVNDSTIEQSTIISGAAVDFSTVKNSTVSTNSSILESSITNSTFTNDSSVFGTTLSGLNCSGAYIANFSVMSCTPIPYATSPGNVTPPSLP